MPEKVENHLDYKNYILIWFTLIILTTISVSASRLNLGQWGILIVLLVTPIKAGIVVNYFMHLKYEKPYMQFMLSIVLAVLAVFIGLTFFDIAFR